MYGWVVLGDWVDSLLLGVGQVEDAPHLSRKMVGEAEVELVLVEAFEQ